MRTIDLNCDLGEDPGAWSRDLELLDLVTSANIACGGHAGDQESMHRAVRAAAERGVAVGAHPGYPDREHFGRRELELAPAVLAVSIAEQVAALAAVARAEDVALRHVKPHGALYNRAARDPLVAAAIAEGVARVDRTLSLVGLAGSRCLEVWREVGFETVAEAFVDRRYESDGSLRDRRHGDALLGDPGAAAAQALGIARDGWALATGGERLALAAETLCLHSDTPGALAIATAVRRTLLDGGFALVAISAPRTRPSH